jgi:hypothetical protein
VYTYVVWIEMNICMILLNSRISNYLIYSEFMRIYTNQNIFFWIYVKLYKYLRDFVWFYFRLFDLFVTFANSYEVIRIYLKICTLLQCRTLPQCHTLPHCRTAAQLHTAAHTATHYCTHCRPLHDELKCHMSPHTVQCTPSCTTIVQHEFKWFLQT